MAKSWQQHFVTGGESVAPAGSGQSGCYWGGHSIENDGWGARRPAGEDGTLSRLWFEIGANGWGTTFNLGIHINANDYTNSNLALTFLTTDNNVAKEDDTSTDSILADDIVMIAGNLASTGTAMVWTRASLVFEPSTDTISVIGINSAGSTNIHSLWGAGVQGWFALYGTRESNTTLDNVDIEITDSFSMTYMSVRTGVVNNTQATPFRSWIDSGGGFGAGNLTVTVTSTGSPGAHWLDDTGSDTLADGYLVATEATLHASADNSVNIEKIGYSLRNTSGVAMMGSGGTERYNAGVDGFWPYSSEIKGEDNDETKVKQAAPFGFTASYLSFELSRSTTSAAPTLTSRVDTGSGSGPGNLTCGGSSTLGWYQDDTHSDEIAVDDAVDIKTNAPTGNNYDIRSLSILVAEAVAAGGSPVMNGSILAGVILGGSVVR